MRKRRPSALLAELERLRHEFGPEVAPRKGSLIASLEGRRLGSPREVERLHESLSFMLAYPDQESVRRRVERMLRSFSRRPDLLRHRAALVNTGIAGTDIIYRFFEPTARWLARRWGQEISIEWEEVEDEERLKRVIPLLVPYAAQPALDELTFSARDWLQGLKAAEETDAGFFIRRFGSLPIPARVAEIFYEELGLYLRLRSGRNTPSRSGARYRRVPVVYQSRPLRRSRPVLSETLSDRPRAIQPVTPREGRRLIDLAREAMVARSRDLDAFAYGDPRDVSLVDWGDGLVFASIGAIPERRLLLEAVYGFLVLKNQVPTGYVLASALFNSSEIAYNVFDTYRGAEAAWVYGRFLATVRHVFGADCFTVYPYQLGHENDEGLASGAFWFYQKLGFRPRDPASLGLMESELRRMKSNPRHRSSRSTLEQLSSRNVYYSAGPPRDDVIGILPLAQVGLGAARYLAERFGSNRERALRRCSTEAAERVGSGPGRDWSPGERLAWARWAPVILRLPGLENWSSGEREALVEVVRAKGGPRESEFVARFDRHRKLRRALVRLSRLASRPDKT